MDQNFLASPRGKKLERRYDTLKEQLASLGWLTHGSVTPNHPANWRWTRKVKAKTVSVALSQEQAILFKQAIANHRKLEAILDEMRTISQEVLFHSAPPTPKNRSRSNIPNLA